MVKTCSQEGILMKKPHTISVETLLTYGLPGCDNTIWFGRHFGESAVSTFFYIKAGDKTSFSNSDTRLQGYMVFHSRRSYNLNIHQAENLKSNIGNTAAFCQKYNYKPVLEPTSGNMWSLTSFHLDKIFVVPPHFPLTGMDLKIKSTSEYKEVLRTMWFR